MAIISCMGIHPPFVVRVIGRSLLARLTLVFCPPFYVGSIQFFFLFFFSDAPAVVPCDRANARDAVVEKACQDHQCVSQSSSSEHIVLNFAEHVFPLSAFFPILFSSARVVA